MSPNRAFLQTAKQGTQYFNYRATALLSGDQSRHESETRNLKIRGWEEPERLPEDQVWARELSTHLSAVFVSSRTPFFPISRCIENVGIPRLFWFDKCSNGRYGQFAFFVIAA